MKYDLISVRILICIASSLILVENFFLTSIRNFSYEKNQLINDQRSLFEFPLYLIPPCSFSVTLALLPPYNRFIYRITRVIRVIINFVVPCFQIDLGLVGGVRKKGGHVRSTKSIAEWEIDMYLRWLNSTYVEILFYITIKRLFPPDGGKMNKNYARVSFT